jgi:hypothetical protein
MPTHTSRLAAFSLLPSVVATSSPLSSCADTAILATSVNGHSFDERAPRYTAPHVNTRGGGPTTTNSLAPTTAGPVTTSTSVKATTTPGHPSTTTTNMAYTTAASLLCDVANWPPSGCQSRNDVGSSAKLVVDNEFNATMAGDAMNRLADLPSCGDDGSSDIFNDGQKKDLRRTGTDLKHFDIKAAS